MTMRRPSAFHCWSRGTETRADAGSETWLMAGTFRVGASYAGRDARQQVDVPATGNSPFSRFCIPDRRPFPAAGLRRSAVSRGHFGDGGAFFLERGPIVRISDRSPDRLDLVDQHRAGRWVREIAVVEMGIRAWPKSFKRSLHRRKGRSGVLSGGRAPPCALRAGMAPSSIEKRLLERRLRLVEKGPKACREPAVALRTFRFQAEPAQQRRGEAGMKGGLECAERLLELGLGRHRQQALGQAGQVPEERIGLPPEGV